jgi:outer membrane protein OmpA-like peptidoglycan-associated protein/tetratricopeptide (TPR) repeat protein
MTVNNRYRKSLLLACLLFVTSIAFSQDIAFKNANFKEDKQGLKLAKESMAIADEMREQGIEKILLMQDANIVFSQAIFHYNKAQAFNPNNAELNYKIGSSLLFTNQKENANSYLVKAKELSANLPAEFLFYYAMALQLNGDYTRAVEQFEQFKDTAKNKVYALYEVFTKKYIKECQGANEVLAAEHRIWVDNLPINTKFDEWSPCLSADGELLIFTSNQPNENQPNEFGVYDQDIYYSNLNARKFSNVLPVSELNTKNDDVSGGLSYDGQRLLIFKQEDGNADVFESKLNGLKWGVPLRKMGEKLRGGNTDGNETFASFDPPDVKVYYITDGGYSGNKNIYFSGVMNRERNLWGKGQSAGHEVNTKFQEGSVYIHPDGKTMYFSSQGHNTLGGYDIFVSYVDDLGHWGEPINLGYPINTPYDELFYSATASGRYAYIASNRTGGKGGLDIYKVTYWGADKPMSTDVQDQLIASIAKPVSDNTIAKPIVVEEKSLTVFKGKVIDAITKKPIDAAIEIVLNETGKIFTSFHSNSATGKFLLSLPAGANYGISVAADGYLFHSENFDLPKGDGFNSVNKDIELKNIKVGSNIALRNVFFNTGKWEVKDDSYAELERLVSLLSDVPTLKIEISGHTDNIGAESFNELLSQRRADAVVTYLVGKGVDKKRLSAKGYGQSKPVDSNETAEGRAANRRTEFEIIEN